MFFLNLNLFVFHINLEFNLENFQLNFYNNSYYLINLFLLHLQLTTSKIFFIFLITCFLKFKGISVNKRFFNKDFSFESN